MINKFDALLEIIGINPFVFVPAEILERIFISSGKRKGFIPVLGTVNGKPYKQTLVRYSGEWRLYINTTMLKNSPKRIGERIEISIDYDPESREVAPPERFLLALTQNPAANIVFEKLTPSRKLEIVRYLAHLKSEESLDKNIEKAVKFLLGQGRFVGRDSP